MALTALVHLGPGGLTYWVVAVTGCGLNWVSRPYLGIAALFGRCGLIWLWPYLVMAKIGHSGLIFFALGTLAQPPIWFFVTLLGCRGFIWA